MLFLKLYETAHVPKNNTFWVGCGGPHPGLSTLHVATGSVVLPCIGSHYTATVSRKYVNSL